MNLNKKIGLLLDNGLNPNFITSLNEGQVTTIYNRLVETKKENKEQAQQGVTTKITTEKVTTINPNALNSPQGVVVDGLNLQNQGGQLVARQMKEGGEMSEKFESKAQQGLFWARCKKCESKNCKWCKMAKEFSDKTTKKDYKKMPEKKHPEKTVKYKKKKTNEEFTMANYFDKVASVYANNAMGKTTGDLTKEQFVKKHINKIVENNLRPTMKKGDLLKIIESEIKRKKGLNEDFYMGDMDEEFDFMSDTETEVEPNWYEDEDDDIPRPRGKMGKLRMGEPDVLEPGIKPKTKPKEPETPEWEPDFDEPMFPDEDTESEPQAKRKYIMGEPDVLEPVRIKPKREIKPETPEWEPDFDEPMSPDEDTESEPQAKGRKNILNRFKDDFDRKMSRMDESTYKPIKYRKF
jgi:hypothetical protein